MNTLSTWTNNILEATEQMTKLEWLLQGEEIKAVFENAFMEIKSCDTGFIAGVLFITNFQLLYISSDKPDEIVVNIPLGTIFRVKIDKKKKKFEQFEVSCKHGRSFIFELESHIVAKNCIAEIEKYAFPPLNHQLFAFIHQAVRASDESAHQPIFNIRDEYKRVGLEDNPKLRILDNSTYQYCDTYPEWLVVPADMDDANIQQVCTFRSRGRIPAVVWQHRGNGALLVRCAQPNIGLQRNRSVIDEKMLDMLRNEQTQQTVLYIMDSRPKANAVANMLRGGGYEFAKTYKNTQLEFNNIENIHVIRNSLLAVHRVCSTLQPPASEYQESDRLLELEESKWLLHLRLILVSVARVVDLVHNQGQSVLVHCSDGWDRTSQTVAAAELLLDPYYRTIPGFLVLIEKEWLQFGHQFALRYGYQEGQLGNYKESQRSPIFPQWLDLLYQLTVLFPSSFEWNEKLLLLLMDELYACRFGTFLCDSSLERKTGHVFDRTRSLWQYVLEHSEEFRNPMYTKNLDFRAIEDSCLILPDLNDVSLVLWTGYFLRHRRTMANRGLAAGSAKVPPKPRMKSLSSPAPDSLAKSPRVRSSSRAPTPTREKSPVARNRTRSVTHESSVSVPPLTVSSTSIFRKRSSGSRREKPSSSANKQLAASSSAIATNMQPLKKELEQQQPHSQPTVVIEKVVVAPTPMPATYSKTEPTESVAPVPPPPFERRRSGNNQVSTSTENASNSSSSPRHSGHSSSSPRRKKSGSRRAKRVTAKVKEKISHASPLSKSPALTEHHFVDKTLATTTHELPPPVEIEAIGDDDDDDVGTFTLNQESSSDHTVANLHHHAVITTPPHSNLQHSTVQEKTCDVEVSETDLETEQLLLFLSHGGKNSAAPQKPPTTGNAATKTVSFTPASVTHQ